MTSKRCSVTPPKGFVLIILLRSKTQEFLKKSTHHQHRSEKQSLALKAESLPKTQQPDSEMKTSQNSVKVTATATALTTKQSNGNITHPTKHYLGKGCQPQQVRLR